MRILLVLKQAGYVRHFDTVIEALADRGHVVRVGCQDGKLDLREPLASHPRVSTLTCPKKRADQWRDYVSLLRRAGDYLRYLEPAYTKATKLRARAFEKLIHTLSDGARTPADGWSDVGLGLTGAERTRLVNLLTLVEDVVPSDTASEAFLRWESPDLLLITPLVDLGSGQTDLVKSARALGIPTGMLLFSWDNLSTKGGIHVLPDRIFVWNELQKREAIDLLGAPESSIVVTGAPRFDRFFELRPATTRAEFCATLGFDPSRPVVVYVGSSKFVSADERRFIQTWMAEIRGSTDPVLAGCNLLIKPHPDRNREWEADPATSVDWPGVGHVRLTRPFDAERVAVARSVFTAAQFLYDCLYHSAAVVGLNTSAELEAGILGRPVYTISVDPAVADGQVSTLHFHYILRDSGGFVAVANGLDDHRRQLSGALAGRYDADGIRMFIKSFLRPAGLDVRATDVLVRGIEEDLATVPGRKPAPLATSRRRDLEKAGEPDRRTPAALRRAASDDGRTLLDYPRETIWLVATSRIERKSRAHACAKEPWAVAWIETYVREGDVIYDIGANVGVFALIAAKRCRNNVTVVAFEPGYASFAHLCDNIVINGCDGSIIPLPVPLSSTTGLAGFRYRTLQPGHNRHALTDIAWLRQKGLRDGRYWQPMLAMRLDDVIDRFDLPYPSHIRLDVNGGELNVLAGARAVLQDRRLRTLLVEIEQALGDSVCGLLEQMGFALAERHQRDDKPLAPWHGLFTRAVESP